MAYPTEDLNDRKYVPTETQDTNDPPRFGQLAETAKDAVKSEFIQYFSDSSDDAMSKITEVPNIEKFLIGTETGNQSLETFVNLIMSYADTPDRLPMVAITSASVRERRLGIGSNFVTSVQYPATVNGTQAGPFNLQEDWYVGLTTWPLGVEEANGVDATQDSTFTFVDTFFADPMAATIDEVVSAINSQALYYTAHANSNGTLRLETGGVLAKAVPNYIEITGGTTQCLAALGLTVGQSDSYTSTSNPPKNRYFSCADMTINIDVVSDGLNTRLELQDAVFSYFTYYLEKRRFQLFGPSYFERDLDPEQWFHIILQGQFNWSGETSIPRPGQEGYDRVYAVRGSVPITIVDYIDKRLVDVPVTLDQAIITYDDTLPDGDYQGDNYFDTSRTKWGR